MQKRLSREELAHELRPPADARERLLTPSVMLVVGAAFAVYLLSALHLGARGGIAYFGADPDYYKLMDRLAYDYTAARFHPSTVLLGLGWMKLFSPLQGWIPPHVLLKAMFATVGAVGVLAAIAAFKVLLPRGYSLLGGILYASSLGVWYFAAIPESKILTATLSAMYIAVYAHYRDDWTTPRTIALNAILAVACFNEIVAGFLIAIPAVDALRRGLDWSQVRWIAAQVVVSAVILLVLEVVVNGWLVPDSVVTHEQSYPALLIHYILRNKYDLASLQDFVASWYFFNLVAPTPHALWWPQTGGYFEPSVAAYFGSPLSMAAILILAAMAVAAFMPGVRGANFGAASGLLLPLAAYAVLRAIFFFNFVPNEALLFSPAATLPHWLLVLVPVAASRLPAKRILLAVLGALMIAANASFMVGPKGWLALWAQIAGA